MKLLSQNEGSQSKHDCINSIFALWADYKSHSTYWNYKYVSKSMGNTNVHSEYSFFAVNYKIVFAENGFICSITSFGKI